MDEDGIADENIGGSIDTYIVTNANANTRKAGASK